MSTSSTASAETPTFAGHPAGLFVLFFAEMWERFSYYGMRALLVFYMTKGFLGYGDARAYDVYAAYTSLVYATPFIGGMLADRLLGARRAVVLGGLLMAAGHLLMTIEQDQAFFGALALLIAGNGFFKPNISTIVGSLYPDHSPKRDGGFTLFYMGINLGAAMAPLLCGYIGETYGWHYGFGLATIGMLVGLAVFVAPTRLTQTLIFGGALAAAGVMFWTQWGDWLMFGVNAPVGVALVAAAAVAFMALNRGPLPAHAGAPPDVAALREPFFGPVTREWAVYGLTLLAVPAFAFLVGKALLSTIVLSVLGVVALVFLLWNALSGTRVERDRLIFVVIMMFFSMLFWAFFELAGSAINNFTDRNIDRVQEDRQVTTQDVGQTIEVPLGQALLGYEAGGQVTTLGGLAVMTETGDTAPVTITEADVGKALPFGSRALVTPGDVGSTVTVKADAALVGYEAAGQKVTEESLEALASASPTVDVALTPAHVGMALHMEDRPAAAGDVGKVFRLPLSKALVGAQVDGTPLTAERLDALEAAGDRVQVTLTPAHVGMALGGTEVKASVFQAANPIFILLFGLAFTGLWGFLGARGVEPSTPVKFSLGLAQLAAGFGVLWYGAANPDSVGMVGMSWLILAYLLHTTGELCLSPVGLSMVTRMSPAKIVSMVMGAWFLATAFSQQLSGIIAKLTSVGGEGEGGGDGLMSIPPPIETVHVYGEVFGQVGVIALISAVVLFVATPLLKRLMHEEAPEGEAGAKRAAGGH